MTYIHKATETHEPFSEKINLLDFPETLKKKITLFNHFKKYFYNKKTRAKMSMDMKEIDETFLKRDSELKILSTNEEVDLNPQLKVSKFTNKIQES